MLRELEDQLREARLEVDRLQASRVMERVMETQVEQLREELREAKENHTPVSIITLPHWLTLAL